MFRITAEEKQWILRRRALAVPKGIAKKRKQLEELKKASQKQVNDVLIPEVLKTLKKLKIEPKKVDKDTKNNEGQISLLGASNDWPILSIGFSDRIPIKMTLDGHAIKKSGVGKPRTYFSSKDIKQFTAKLKESLPDIYTKLKEKGANSLKPF